MRCANQNGKIWNWGRVEKVNSSNSSSSESDTVQVKNRYDTRSAIRSKESRKNTISIRSKWTHHAHLRIRKYTCPIYLIDVACTCVLVYFARRFVLFCIFAVCVCVFAYYIQKKKKNSRQAKGKYSIYISKCSSSLFFYSTRFVRLPASNSVYCFWSSFSGYAALFVSIYPVQTKLATVFQLPIHTLDAKLLFHIYRSVPLRYFPENSMHKIDVCICIYTKCFELTPSLLLSFSFCLDMDSVYKKKTTHTYICMHTKSDSNAFCTFQCDIPRVILLLWSK